jgi:hypothetical protein
MFVSLFIASVSSYPLKYLLDVVRLMTEKIESRLNSRNAYFH